MLIGLPIKEYEAQLFKPKKEEDGTVTRVPAKVVWGTEQVFKSMNPKSYQFTGNTRTGYAKPAWVPSYNEKGNLVVLDDYSRAVPIFLNAMMDLIKDQEYVSWKFPEKTFICLTTNPDNGVYNVSASDPAQQRRYFTFNMEFNLDDWSAWAEKAGIDGPCRRVSLCGYDPQGGFLETHFKEFISGTFQDFVRSAFHPFRHA